MALDFAAGCLGGCAGVLVGHPLDTIKVRLQTQDFRNPQYKGTYDCFKTILRTEKVAGLYKGMSSPMAGVAFVNAIVFGVYGNVQRKLPNPDAVSSHFVAGASAGFAQSFICSPMELAKTRLQLQGQGQTNSPYGIASSASGPRAVLRYKNPLDCLVQVAKKEGWRRGVFRGLGMTLTREIPGCGTYFLSYEMLTRGVNTWSGSKELSTFQMAMAGGIAGTISWVLTYPVDVLKSRLQADGVDGVRRYEGVADCLRKSIKEEGRGFLVRGLNSTIIRAFPVNAACFTVVTWVFRLCGVSSTEEDTSSAAIATAPVVERVGKALEEPVGRWLPELAMSKNTQVAQASSQFGLNDFLQMTKGVSSALGLSGDALPVALIDTSVQTRVDPALKSPSSESDVCKMGEPSAGKVSSTTKQDPSPPFRERSYSLSRGSWVTHDSNILVKLGHLSEEKIASHIHLDKEYSCVELF
ncbi:mitochondrial basic amino acids transporter-like [Ischnura elegans]|uniref:mitochondrial basic amino acids transporter-like n=1 Tax=Ischnura elegans TaxID=197161 RepID=UPI001ED89A32|nr:mitochondrial basic amino acids transporter-like [Ischnura elegans]XP_046387560.1 mitochondrial basic amino acids transporter-like [Ischnura elegans]